MSLTREQRQFIRERRAELTRDAVSCRAAITPQRRPEVALPPHQGLDEPLSRRELQVLVGAAEGLTYRRAGERLGICESTAKQYGQGAIVKLGARTITQATVIAERRGLLGDVRS